MKGKSYSCFLLSIIRWPLMVLAVSVLSACGTLGRTAFQAPAVDIPLKWETASTGQGIAATTPWWHLFQDPDLNQVVEDALKRNNDLAVAAVKVQRAQLQAGLADTNRVPDISLSSNASGQNRLKHNNNRSRSFSASLSLSYELDLWGKMSAVRDAAAWEAQATEQDRQAAALSLIGTTAELYWKTAYLKQRIANSQASIQYAEKTLSLTQSRFNAGAVSRLDVIQAEQNLASQKAEHTQLQQQLGETRHAMAILFDQSPQQPVFERSSLNGLIVPPVKSGLPVELLSRRPDLKAAELRLRSTLADVDQVRTSYYPTLTLTGSAGDSSDQLTKLLRDPVGTLGAGLVLPFIQFRTMKLNTRIAQTQYEEAVINFRQTLYKSLSEVEDALSAKVHYQEQGKQLEKSYALAKQAEQLTEIKYRAGKVPLQEWLDQQNTRRIAENTLLDNRLNRLTNAMTVYQALGGAQAVSAP